MPDTNQHITSSVDQFGFSQGMTLPQWMMDSSSGVRFFPADITTGTLTSSDDLGDDPTSTSFGMPFQLHKLWADAIIAEWKEENGRDLTQNELTIKQFLDVSNTINALNGFNADRKIIVGMRESEWGQGFGDRWSQDNPLNL